MDPFLTEFRDNSLYCISTGKVIPADTAKSILSTQTQGQTWYEEFKAGCFADSDRFGKPIPRRKVKSFVCNAVSVKLPVKDRRIKELQGTRDLFSRLLYLSTVKDIFFFFFFFINLVQFILYYACYILPLETRHFQRYFPDNHSVLT